MMEDQSMYEESYEEYYQRRARMSEDEILSEQYERARRNCEYEELYNTESDFVLQSQKDAHVHLEMTARMHHALKAGAVVDFEGDTRVFRMNGTRMTSEEINALKGLNGYIIWVAQWAGRYFDKEYPLFRAILIDEPTS
jgi:hypothetical protein